MLSPVLVPRANFAPDPARGWLEESHWPARWVCHPEGPAAPFVSAYRLRLSLTEPLTARIHVSADERYQLFINGQLLARGSERGAPNQWFYESFDLTLPPGEHVLVARVWSLGPLSPQAQMSVYPGFLLAAEAPHGALLSTGVADWSVKLLPGYAHRPPVPAFWKGASVQIDGAAFAWGFELGLGDGWLPVHVRDAARDRVQDWELRPRHRLQAATLPAQIEAPLKAGAVRLVTAPPSLETQPIPMREAEGLDTSEWQHFISGGAPVHMAAHTRRRVIIDLTRYNSAYPTLVLSGGAGATVRLLWSEAPFLEQDWWHGAKGDRNVIEGCYFMGMGDVFLPDGGARRVFDTLWWQCGRYLELCVETADAPLTLEQFTLTETRYPLENESRFDCDDARIAALIPILTRGIQMTAHETYCDGPFWEEMQYVADTRLECLCTHVMTRDARLPAKALTQFDASRMPDGLTQSRFPTRVPQVIAPFSLFWVLMARDHAYWRDAALVRTLMPGVRQTMAAFERVLRSDGLLGAPEGWNFIDWIPNWDATGGAPPSGIAGVSAPFNWQYAFTLTHYADLETQFGEHELAARAMRMARRLAAALTEQFWDTRRGLFADDLDHTRFGEHAQCFAVLSGLLSDAQRESISRALANDLDLERATIYFKHYLFEAYRALNRMDLLFNRLEQWHGLAADGLTTPVEKPNPRSDCHGWGSHPLFHLYASMLGIRPAGLDFAQVEIQPQLGPLGFACCELVHPRGVITAEFSRDGDALRGRVLLPTGVSGTLRINGAEIALGAGETRV
jgi:alpha-L-rhamnosidase